MPIQTVTAQFENPGDTDWFRVRLVAGQSYQMRISGSYQGLLMAVMQPDGQEMRFPIGYANVANFVAPVTGDYFVAGTQSGGPSGSVYSITVEDYADPIPASTATSASLAVGETLTVVSNFSFPSFNNDWFAIDLVAGQSYVLSTDSITGSVYIADAEGAVVAIEGFFAHGEQQAHFTATETGRYYAGAQHSSGSTYKLKLLAIADDHGDTAAGAGSLAVGGAVNGRWESGGDDDAYAITLTAGASYKFSVSSVGDAAFASYIQILDEAGRQVWTSYGQPSAQTTLFSPDSDGTYYVVASLNSITSHPDHPDTYLTGWDYALNAVAVAGELTDNALTTGALTVGAAPVGGVWEALGDRDWLEVDLVAGQTYLFNLASSAWNGAGLALFDDQGNRINVSIGGSPSGTLLAHTAGATGSYFVSALAGQQTGSYTISAAAVADDFANNAATTGHLVANGAAAAGVSESYADSDWFAIDLIAGLTYKLVSGPVFVGLAVRDAEGNFLTRGSSEDISFTPSSSGTYFVEAGGANGAYSFTVQSVADDYIESAGTIGVIRTQIGGTAGADTFVSTEAYEYFIGGGGDDLFVASTGYDFFEGGAGSDTVSYAGLAEAITVDLRFTFSEIDGALRDILVAENVVGTAFDDVIIGWSAANFIDGGAGADRMQGFGGNDTYIVDAGGDLVLEAAGGGRDVVYARTSYTLAAGTAVEVLSVISQGGGTIIDLTGNELVNELYGNTEANFLDGGGGADYMAGFGGDDIYVVDQGGDVIAEAAGEGRDVVYARANYTLNAGAAVEILSVISQGTGTRIDLTGNELGQELYGNTEGNFLDGGGGADYMAGFGGDDIYVVDQGGDVIAEAAGEGRDVVYARASYTLNAGAAVEVLSVISQGGGTIIDLTGNELVNELYGNTEANFLDGGGGADYMQGFGGNDNYVVETQGDFVAEGVGEGNHDVVYARASYALGAGQQIEILSAQSQGATTALDLSGNEFANELYGNDGVNVLNGGAGGDYLVGYGGADRFAFTTALGGGNIDQIADFLSGTDTIQLDDAVFTGLGLGALGANAFVVGATAQDADDRIVYDSATGALWYDADGNGAGAAVQFATIAGHPLVAAGDFTVI